MIRVACFALILTGCGGDFSTAQFTALDAPDAAPGGSTSTGGAPQAATGGARTTGGSPSTGGADTGGSPPATGGAPTTGGVTGTGGAPIPCGGAGFSTHDNGTGQTWQDCTPVGTYDNAQATKACEAWCAVNVDCVCFVGGVDVLGNGGATNAVHGDIDGAQMIWLWKSPYDGDVMRSAPKSTPWVKIGTWT